MRLRRVLALLAILVVSLFGLMKPAAAIAQPASASAIHTYDDSEYAAAPTHTTTERGPPSATYDYTTYDAVDRWSHGASERPDGSATTATTTYDYLDTLAPVARATTTTARRAVVADGESSSVQPAQDAANTSTRLAQDIGVNPAAPRALSLTGRSVGRATHDAEIQKILAGLRGQGASDIRINQQQVNALRQRVGINRPDLQYTLDGRRYYVEIEGLANPRGAAHEARILANDPLGAFDLRLVN